MIKEIYLNDEHKIVSKEESTYTVVQELDENGILQSEIISINKKPWETPNYNDLEYVTVSPELQEILDNCKDKNGNYMFRK